MALTSSDIAKILNGTQQMIDYSVNLLKSELQEEISHLPTKDEFYNKMDEIMGELSAIRENTTAMEFRISQHSDQIDSLEKIHPSGKHV